MAATTKYIPQTYNRDHTSYEKNENRKKYIFKSKKY